MSIKGVKVIGIAKGISRRAGQETLYLGSDGEEIVLSPESPALHLLQNIRDESHRFAITGHRAKRQKASKKSVLESIEGIGAKKRQTLLTHLGGIQEVNKANLTELEKVNISLIQSIEKEC